MTNGTDPISWPAKPYPLGATRDGEDANFALFTDEAEKVRLCFFAQDLLLSADHAEETGERGQRICNGNFVILMNAHRDEVPFPWPLLSANARSITLVDTSCQTSQGANRFYSAGKAYPLQRSSLVRPGEPVSDRIRVDGRRRAQLP